MSGAADDEPERGVEHLDERPDALRRARALRRLFAEVLLAASTAVASTAASPRDPSSPVGPHDEPRARLDAGGDDSTTVTTLMGRSSSNATRSAPATSAAFSAGSMNTSIAPLHPRPRPQTASSSAVRSHPARRARPSSITTRAMSATSPSRQPPEMLPTGEPSSGTRSRAPGRR